MLRKFRVVYAKNKSVVDLVDKGLLDKNVADLMREIAGSSYNIGYGTMALKHQFVKCNYTAAATIFARLAVYFTRNPENGLTDREWRLACNNSLIFAGASPDEVPVVMQGLIEMHEKIDAKPLL